MIILKKKKKIIILGAIIVIALLLFKTKVSHGITVNTIVKKENKYEILVDVEESKLYLLNNGKIESSFLCSGGKPNTPSPIGTWKIIQKEKWGEGFRWILDGLKCSMGEIWNTWNIRS